MLFYEFVCRLPTSSFSQGCNTFFWTIAQKYSLFCLSLYQLGLVFFQNFCITKENLHIGHGIFESDLGPLEPNKKRAVNYK